MAHNTLIIVMLGIVLLINLSVVVGVVLCAIRIREKAKSAGNTVTRIIEAATPFDLINAVGLFFKKGE